MWTPILHYQRICCWNRKHCRGTYSAG